MSVAAIRAVNVARRVELPGGERLELFTDMTITVNGGRSLAIMGRSGSGKTSLLSVLGLLSAPDAGYVEVAGNRVDGLTDRARATLRNRAIGFVFQSYSLIQHMSAFRNVELPLLQDTYVSRPERRRLVSEALSLAEISHRADSTPRQLSGGEQQRVAVARALVRRPHIIIADEPTAALDRRTADTLLDPLVTASAERGSALILATHDRDIADRAMSILELDHESGSHVTKTPAAGP